MSCYTFQLSRDKHLFQNFSGPFCLVLSSWTPTRLTRASLIFFLYGCKEEFLAYPFSCSGLVVHLIDLHIFSRFKVVCPLCRGIVIMYRLPPSVVCFANRTVEAVDAMKSIKVRELIVGIALTLLGDWGCNK